MNVDPLLQAALRHWGARAVPFSDQSNEAPFVWPGWDQAWQRLNQTAALRALLLLTGDNGVGKSALAGRWLASLEPKAYLPLVITQATLSPSGVLAVLARKLGQTSSSLRSRTLHRLEEAFKELGRLTPVLVLDEAQLYPPGALEEVRLLLGLNLARQPVFALVLIGDNYLHDTLRLQQHKALYSRISVQYQLPALERGQIEAYLDHALRQVGLERPCFQPAAVELLAGASSGIPRLLNLLARAAWLASAQASLNTIGPEQVQAALELVPAARDRLNP
jgi:type II secretory pathway predicted ATPase ExeA